MNAKLKDTNFEAFLYIGNKIQDKKLNNYLKVELRRFFSLKWIRDEWNCLYVVIFLQDWICLNGKALWLDDGLVYRIQAEDLNAATEKELPGTIFVLL